MAKSIKSLISETSPVRLLYHKLRALLANIRYGFPARKLEVIGVTGTNGKTTTTTLLAKMFTVSGRNVALASTIQFQIGEKMWRNETHKTTLDAFALQKFLREAVNAGVDLVILEVSSHALVQGRTLGIRFNTAVFTNLMPEHLDYHKTMDGYCSAKEILFEKLGGKPGTVSVVNGLDERAERFLRYPAEKSWLTIAGGEELEIIDFGRELNIIRAVDIKTEKQHTSFLIRWGENLMPIKMQLLGHFNVENALLATATALAKGIDPEIIKQVIESVPLIPGRLEPVEAGQEFRALLDYAVTPDSLEKLYSTVRRFTPGRIIAVFGACGDRDRTKRPHMGRVAGELADLVVITNEEPYTEDPIAIIDAVAEGVRQTSKQEGLDLFIIHDRREAIDHAVALAEPGDTIILSGMGDQTSMVWGDKTIPWVDREELRDSILNKIQ